MRSFLPRNRQIIPNACLCDLVGMKQERLWNQGLVSSKLPSVSQSWNNHQTGDTLSWDQYLLVLFPLCMIFTAPLGQYVFSEESSRFD